MTTASYETLRRGAALYDLSERGTIRVSGKDRIGLLQGLVTNDVKAVPPGRGCEALILTPKGKLVAHLVALVLPDTVLLDCEPQLAEKVTKLVQRYVVFQEAAIVSETGREALLHVEGPKAGDVLGKAGVAPLPSPGHAHVSLDLDGQGLLVVAESRGGEPGFDLRLSRDAAGSLSDRLRASGAQIAELESLETARIEAGLPRWGAELDETVLPDEAWLNKTAVSYTKGCYIGQETVARIKTYGHVNRHLVHLLLPVGCDVRPRAAVRSGESLVGVVTSVAFSPQRGAPLAIAFVGRSFLGDGTALAVDTELGAVAATVTPLPQR